jgi:hypothetical protein
VIGGGTSEAGEALLRRVRGLVPRELARTRLIVAGLGTQSAAIWRGVGRGRGPAHGVPPVTLGGLDRVGAIASQVQVGRELAPSGACAAGGRTQGMRMDDRPVERGSSADVK